jgi:hypothetical protein
MRKAVTGAIVTILATTGLTTGVGPADATTCGYVLTGPSIPDVVMPATGSASVPVTVRVRDMCASPLTGGVFSVSVQAAISGKDVTTAYLQKASGDTFDSTWSGVLTFDRTSDVGTWAVDVTAISGLIVTNVGVDTFRLRRDTQVRADARPDPVRRDGSIRVSGRLQRLTLGLDYVNWRNKDVRIYFQRAGRTARNWVGMARTGADGRFHATFTAHHTGRWYAYFPGTTANTSKFSAGQRVVVTR